MLLKSNILTWKYGKLDQFLHSGFLINQKINVAIGFCMKNTAFYQVISHFEILTENNGPPTLGFQCRKSLCHCTVANITRKRLLYFCAQQYSEKTVLENHRFKVCKLDNILFICLHLIKKLLLMIEENNQYFYISNFT